jgi:organic hydroperoxide reductase OsmC/OhrA
MADTKSEDGLLDLSLAMPKTLGGSGVATNPEQLFAEPRLA